MVIWPTELRETWLRPKPGVVLSFIVRGLVLSPYLQIDNTYTNPELNWAFNEETDKTLSSSLTVEENGIQPTQSLAQGNRTRHNLVSKGSYYEREHITRALFHHYLWLPFPPLASSPFEGWDSTLCTYACPRDNDNVFGFGEDFSEFRHICNNKQLNTCHSAPIYYFP